jgi:hypothetical protein
VLVAQWVSVYFSFDSGESWVMRQDAEDNYDFSIESGQRGTRKMGFAHRYLRLLPRRIPMISSLV